MDDKKLTALKTKIIKMRWMFFDVDGVFTDGSLFYGADGEVLKRFNALDGFGIKELKKNGIGVGLISGRDHAATRIRANELGISIIMLGKENKLEAFTNWSNSNKIDPKTCGHMGDDYPDLELFSAVGFAASVPNAIEEVKQNADFVTTKSGGEGAVREIAHLITEYKGKSVP